MSMGRALTLTGIAVAALAWAIPASPPPAPRANATPRGISGRRRVSPRPSPPPIPTTRSSSSRQPGEAPASTAIGSTPKIRSRYIPGSCNDQVGGGVTPTVPLHHRTCVSVYGGLGRLTKPVHMVYEREEPQPFEIGFRKGSVHMGCPGIPPRAPAVPGALPSPGPYPTPDASDS